MAIDANMYVLNPVFKADTFQETVAPLQLYAQAYKEQEAKVEDMTDKAAALEWIANQDPESQTAALYRDMSNKIKGLRDDIMTNGLMGGLRSRILGARRAYSANSAEITRRYESMQKYQERMEQMYDKDNSVIFSPESQNVSLDSFAGGKRPKIKAISGNEIMTRGAAIGKRLTSLIFGDGVEGTIAGEQFWKFYKDNGMTDAALEQALKDLGKGDKYSLAKKVIDGVYNSFADFDPESQNILKNRFMEGVYDGAVYNREVSYQQNMNFESDAAKETRLFNQRMAENENRRAEGTYNAQMMSYGFVPEAVDSNGNVTKWKVGPNGIAKPGTSSSGSGSGSGSGGSGRISEFPPMYMTGDDAGLSRVYVTNGAHTDKDGNDVTGGSEITFEDTGDGVLAAKCKGIVIARYDTDNHKLLDFSQSDDEGEIRKALGIEKGHSPFINNHWRYSDKKLLENLSEQASKIVTYYGEGGLSHYTFKFLPDKLHDDNGSIYIGPSETVYPTWYDYPAMSNYSDDKYTEN